jgi:serine/threonine protein phosphatase 1
MSGKKRMVTTANASLHQKGQRVYVLSDIHGWHPIFLNMLDLIEQDMQTTGSNVQDGRVVFLGDYIDGGPDSYGVIERVCHPMPCDLKPTFLKGNHEDPLIEFLRTQGKKYTKWFAEKAGRTTIRSYFHALMPEGTQDFPVPPGQSLFEIFNALVPPAHRNFLERLTDSLTLGDYHFVHAGIDPSRPLDRQDPWVCRHIHKKFTECAVPLGKVVVHGHTCTPGRYVVGVNQIGIDSGARRTGILTALVLEGNTRRFLQTAPFSAAP